MNEAIREERKRLVKLLYTEMNKTVTEIADETELDEVEISCWIQAEGWDGIRRSLLISKRTQLENMYGLLQTLYAKMRGSEDVSLKDADLYTKYTAAINNLETDVTVANIIEVAELFVKWLRRRDLELTKVVTLQFDAFIKEKMSPLNS